MTKFKLCKHAQRRNQRIGEKKTKDDLPSTGGVYKECDQGGGGRTHTVESQHGILELLLTHNMI